MRTETELAVQPAFTFDTDMTPYLDAMECSSSKDGRDITQKISSSMTVYYPKRKIIL